MLKLYKKYLEVVDTYLEKCFTEQQPFIHCKSGCTDCCKTGEYPFSRLEIEYLMAGFTQLDIDVQTQIKNNISELLQQKHISQKPFLHKCPFLIDKKCALYERRAITCRSFGLAYFENVNGKKVIKLPECAKIGLNYSQVLANGTVDIEKFQTFGVQSPVKHSLNLDFFEKEILKGIPNLTFGEIRPLLDWFDKKY